MQLVRDWIATSMEKDLEIRELSAFQMQRKVTMESYPNLSWEMYLQELRKPKVIWCDELCLLVVSLLLRKEIILVTTDRQGVPCVYKCVKRNDDWHYPYSEPPLILANLHERHYESLHLIESNLTLQLPYRLHNHLPNINDTNDIGDNMAMDVDQDQYLENTKKVNIDSKDLKTKQSQEIKKNKEFFFGDNDNRKVRGQNKSVDRMEKDKKYQQEKRRKIDESHKKRGESAEDRYRNMYKDLKDTWATACISCHRLVSYVNGKRYKGDIKECMMNLKKDLDKKQVGLYERCILSPDDPNFPKRLKDIIKATEEIILCYTCNRSLRVKKLMPYQCVMNGLQIDQISNDDERAILNNLNDLEKTLISKRIMFIKIFKTPKSRWNKTIDRCVNVPVPLSKILNILNKICPLPREPDEAGLIEISLKRQLKYKNTVIKRFVRGDVLVKAVQILKKYHPSYKNVTLNKEFNILIEDEDVDDSSDEDLISVEEKNEDVEINTDSGNSSNSVEEETEINIGEYDENSDYEVEEDAQEEYGDDEVVQDSIRNHQFDVGGQTCMTDLYPETNVKTELVNKDNTDSKIDIAPGEGETPINLLRDENFDTEGFPVQHPRGRFGLNYSGKERERRLTIQKYFTQRISNINPIFSSDKSYVFTALNYIEMDSLERSINISYQRGKVVNGCLENTENSCSILDNIKGSCKYWQKRKHEVLAKLEQLGPFQFFFTLSCADKRWEENFVSILKLDGLKVKYEARPKKNCGDGDYSYEHYNIYVKPKDKEEFILLAEYLKDKDLHEMVRKNVLTITMNFDKRVKAFIKNIVMSSSNPMRNKFFHYRVEFQLRGAGHIHGVLWCDIEKLVEENLELKGLQEIMLKLRRSKLLDEKEKKITARFVDLFVSCSLKKYKDLTETIKKVQTHNHCGNPKKKTGCYKKGPTCRFNYPRFPSKETIIAQPLRQNENERDEDFEKRKEKMKLILMKVKMVLEQLTENDLKDMSIKDILKKCNVKEEDYYEALSSSNMGSCVVLEREPNEIYINNYNAEWLKAWDGNIDLAVCLDFFAIITYITDYYTKVETEMMTKLNDVAKACKGMEKTEQMRFLAQAFMKSRQTGESEAYYRIFPHLTLSNSNLKCKFVATGFPWNRSQFARKVLDKDGNSTNENDEDEENNEDDSYFPEMLTISGKDGKYQRKITDHEKYAARPNSLEKMCFAQFISDYDQDHSKKKNKKDELFAEQVPACMCGYESECKCRKVITCSGEEESILPSHIKLRNNLGYMKKRLIPAILRYHKHKEHHNPHEYMYSQLQLWLHWRNERELCADDFEKCQQLLLSSSDQVQQVQEGLFPSRKAVEEARAIIENFPDPRPSHFGDNLDSQNEQANEDAAMEGMIEDPDFAGRYPREEFNNDKNDFCPEKKNLYQRVPVPMNKEQLKAMLLSVTNLDKDQFEVFMRVIEFGKKERTSFLSNTEKPIPPLIKVHGGAGCGKSFLINRITEVFEYWYAFGNREPDKPTVLKLAPTGKSAKVIGGHTLHTGLGIGFGNSHFSLSDERREAIRNQLSDLKLVIIDEMSMVKSDILYQLFLRLQEIKQSKMDFGGVAVLLFGDLLQLKPIKAKWIFESPRGTAFKLSHSIQSLWELFEPYELTFNHRQGEDKEYGNLLNRLRWLPPFTKEEKKKFKYLSAEERTKRDHRLSEEDKQLLASRLTNEKPENAIYIFGKTLPVKNFNEEKLDKWIGNLETMEAYNSNTYQKKFEPRLETNGLVKNTPLMQTLKLKLGVKVMITYNMDTSDGLTNGTTGMS